MKRKKREKKQRSRLDIAYIIIDLLRFVVIIYLIVMLLSTFVMRKKTVVGPSMYPTLIEDEKVVVNVAAAWISEIHRFDVVVAKSKLKEEELWVKRVIALPHETVSYKKGQLYIDGNLIRESFLNQAYMNKDMKDRGLSYFTQDFAEITLKEGEYLLVGDNRNDSLDSRNSAVGPFQRDQIIAKGLFVYSPLSKARYVSNGD